MKKIIVVLLITILLCGCKNKYITCNINITNDTMEYTLNGEYKIYYKNSYVKKISKYEEYKTSNRDTLNYLKVGKDLELNSLNDKYSGYTYEVVSDKKSVKINIEINLEDVDVKQMVKDYYLDEYYVNNDKLTLGGTRLFYESKGAICEGGES